jgi:lipopolysaccharide exporter
MSIVSEIQEVLRDNKRVLMSGDGVKAKLFRGGAWLGTGSVLEQTLRFGRNLILTRLLAPEAFGLMAITLSFSSIIHTITDIGVKEAIIQNPKGDQREYVGAAWWLAFGRALSIYVCLFVASPWVAKFYGNPELVPLLRVAALGVIFDGALSSKAYIAVKNMKFGKWAGINHGGGIIGVVTTVLLSFFIRDVWALALGYVSESVARCVLSYVLCPYVPRFEYNRLALRDLLHFSKGLFGLSFLNLIFARADIFVLGKLFSPAEIGLYSMAVYLVQTPTSFLMNLLGQTILPTFSQMQSDHARINRILVSITALLVFVGMPLILFLFFCGGSLLTLAYGARYSIGAAALTAAAAVAILNLANGQLTTVFYASGIPQMHRKCVAIMAGIMIVMIYPAIRIFGILGGQLGCLLAISIGFLFQVFRIHRLTGLNLSEYGNIFLKSALISLTVLAVCIGARLFLAANRPFPNVMFGALGCLLAYGLSTMLLLRSRRRAA